MDSIKTLDDHLKEMGLTKDEVNDMLVECYRSTRVCAKVLFPERFYAPFSSLHDQIFEAIDSGAPKVAIAAPRGIGKTSIVGLALAGKAVLFRDRHVLPYISKSHDNSCLQTENLKRELLTNKLVRVLFGSIKTKDAELDEMFSKKAWVANNHTLVMPRGSGQQIRGLLYINYRPDMLVIDDLEDPETIDNEEQRTKRKNWFHADVEKCVSRVDKKWRMIYIDTLKHEDSLLQDLLDSSEWESLRLEICDDDLNPTAPEFFSKEDVMKEYNYHKEHGMLDIFYREFRNIPVAKEDASFRQENFRYYEEAELQKKKGIENFLIVDPAKTKKMKSAHSAIICAGIDLAGRAIYIRDVFAGMVYPDELYTEMFGMASRWNVHVVGIEVTSLHAFITQPLKNEMSKRGQFFEIIELNASGHKEDRVKWLVPYYRSGYIFHNPTCCTALEAQLLSFPRPKRWDIIDCAAYIVKMLDEGERYFEPPAPEAAEKEFAERDYDDPVESFRDDDGWGLGNFDERELPLRGKMKRYGLGGMQ